MMTRLHIANYALIDQLDIDFGGGLNIITGETGAGKSIMLGALGLLLGARADSRVIRRSDSKSVVEASFDVKGNEALARWAELNDVEWDATECILRRELNPSGRSRAFINDSPVTLAQLGEAGALLIDIHSQHQNQLLASREYQLKIIDAVAANKVLLEAYEKEYSAWLDAVRRLEKTRRQIEQNAADREFIAFQLEKLDAAQLLPGEQEELESERGLQANMTQIKETMTAALDSLSADEGALSRLTEAVDAVQELADLLEDAGTLAERLESARLEIQDVAETLADYDSNLTADPRELEIIEERLSMLYTLQQRHKVDSVEALIRVRDELREKLDAIDNADVTLGDLQKEERRLHKQAHATAMKLRETRVKAAKEFASHLQATARGLGMPNLECSVELLPEKELKHYGLELIELLFAFNKNQTPTSVSGAASGGEVSRLMLSVKAIMASKLNLPTIVFDEVDTGVSGDVANRMGEMMQAMGRDLQVITITHLPQVAAMGAEHFKVFKEDDEEATHTRIRRLDAAEREGELALMLSGRADDEAALANARALLSRAHS